MTHRKKLEQNENRTKTTERLWTFKWIDNWQFSVIYLIFFFNCVVILFHFAQLSFNNQLMESVRDHLINFKSRARTNEKGKETEAEREWERNSKNEVHKKIYKSHSKIGTQREPTREFMRARCTDLAITQNWVTRHENGEEKIYCKIEWNGVWPKKLCQSFFWRLLIGSGRLEWIEKSLCAIQNDVQWSGHTMSKYFSDAKWLILSRWKWFRRFD